MCVCTLPGVMRLEQSMMMMMGEEEFFKPPTFHLFLYLDINFHFRLKKNFFSGKFVVRGVSHLLWMCGVLTFSNVINTKR